ncbi:hypothetical protein DRV85_13555 [Rhodosalinus halophilus]|uniref:Major facilitator superfamily (MFS) profile domain-containing protein n=1 Tax=Rhodosalinus halophilus TaxID=2259333 RepID=A0A365U696_9RHOB|nr:hypothetical protein [Rhodosalinus halophilus]RBI84037.1 hypothetical protein DRV85_13555 [Rhodosalinus halophilus]
MALAGILLGAFGGMAAALVALAMGAGWLQALALYVFGGAALALILIAVAALRQERPAADHPGAREGQRVNP